MISARFSRKAIFFIAPFFLYLILIGTYTTKLYLTYQLGGDFAAYDNTIYRATQGDGFRSSVGASVMQYWPTVSTKKAPYPEISSKDSMFGIHFIPTLWLTNVLPSLIFNSPVTTLWMQTFFVALAGLLISVFALQVGVPGGLACGLGVSFLIHPATLGANVNDFHPILMAVPFLLGMLIALNSKKYALFWILAVLACGVQENAPISVAAISLVLFSQRRWFFALALIVISLGYFLAVTQYVIPSYNPSGVLAYGGIYGSPLGGDMGQIVKNGLTHPVLLLKVLLTKEHFQWFALLLTPVLFLSLASPIYFLVALAGVAPNLLSTNKAMKIMWGQYNCLALPFFYVGAAATLVMIFRWVTPTIKQRLAPFLTILILVISFVWSAKKYAMAQSSFRSVFLPWNYPDLNSDKRKSYDKVAAMIPKDASVSAPESLLTHIHRRKQAYIYPVSFWTVDFAILDKKGTFLVGKEQEQFNQELKKLRYTVAYEDDFLMVWKRPEASL